MIQKVSVASLDKNSTPLQIRDNKQSPSFTGIADLAIRAMQRCEAEPMVNVTVLDLATAIIPRSIIETVAASKQTDENGNVIRDENGKVKRKFNFLAGFEALRRESSGLFINCILPGAFVIPIAMLMSGKIMGKGSNLAHNWADRETLKTLNSFYLGSGAENYSNTLKNMFLDLKGVDGKEIDKSFAEIYKSDPETFDKIFTHLGQMADSEGKLDKKAINKAISNIVDKTHISENIKFTKNNPDGKYFGNSLEALLKNSVEVLHDSKNVGISSADEFGKYITKAQKLVKWKSLGGLSIIIPLALAAQPINRWITHKTGGKKGAPIYNDNEERHLTKEEKSKLLKQKFVSIGSMLGLSWLSMMKIPTFGMLEFKKFFPSMDQARIVSTATFASRMGASEDFNDLRESTVRDLATFSSFYFLGDYAAKGIASFIEWLYKDEGVKLINDLKPLKEGANVFEKFWHWTKHTALKSTSELPNKRAENLRSVCQLGNLAFSLISLGVFIPLINRIQTNKREQARKAMLAQNAQNQSAGNSTGAANASKADATAAATNNAAANANKVAAATASTGAGGQGIGLMPVDKKKTAFGAFFNS